MKKKIENLSSFIDEALYQCEKLACRVSLNLDIGM
jgi:hypothetical protein